jgi:hypothetical protein
VKGPEFAPEKLSGPTHAPVSPFLGIFALGRPVAPPTRLLGALAARLCRPRLGTFLLSNYLGAGLSQANDGGASRCGLLDVKREMVETLPVPAQVRRKVRAVRMPYGGVSVITPFNFPLEIYGVKSREGGMLATAARSFSCARRPT